MYVAAFAIAKRRSCGMHSPGASETALNASALSPLTGYRKIESTTVGGLVTEWLGRVPQTGEFVERDGIHIDVLASDERRVERVRVRRSQAVNA